MAKARKDSKGRALKNGESQRTQDGRYVYTYTNSVGKRTYIYALTLEELREKEENLIRNQLDGIKPYKDGKEDLNFLVDRYMATKNNLASSTYANYMYMYDRFCREGFGLNIVTDIRYSDILYFYQGLVMDGIEPKTVETLHCVLHPAFAMAVRDDVIRKNPTDGALSELRKVRKDKKKKKSALTIEEQIELMEFVESHPYYSKWRQLFTVLLGTGCRIGEVCGLRWKDIDLENRLIDINHSMTFFRRGKRAPYTYEFKVGPPKTDAGYRKIPMLDEVYDVFVEMYEYQKEHGFSSLVVDGETGFIFTNDEGKLFKHTTINHSIAHLVKAHNKQEVINAKADQREPIFLPKFSCHTLRHTFCTRFCENEPNVKVIQSIMGHSDIKTTMDIYAEATENKKQESMDNLSKRMKIFPGKSPKSDS